jgi:hypothetical protein
MEQKHVDEAERGGYAALGPTYFSAREAAEKFMEGFESEQFRPLLKKFTTAFTDEMWEKFNQFLIMDTTLNIQSHIWRDVDAIIEAILGGVQWPLQRYVLPDRINCEHIRETVAKLIPDEIASNRIADLEKEVRDLKSTLEGYRGRY